MTDIKEPINTTSDGTFLSVMCENPQKVLLAKGWGGHSPPPQSPPGITPLLTVHYNVLEQSIAKAPHACSNIALTKTTNNNQASNTEKTQFIFNHFTARSDDALKLTITPYCAIRHATSELCILFSLVRSHVTSNKFIYKVY